MHTRTEERRRLAWERREVHMVMTTNGCTIDGYAGVYEDIGEAETNTMTRAWGGTYPTSPATRRLLFGAFFFFKTFPRQILTLEIAPSGNWIPWGYIPHPLSSHLLHWRPR